MQASYDALMKQQSQQVYDQLKQSSSQQGNVAARQQMSDVERYQMMSSGGAGNHGRIAQPTQATSKQGPSFKPSTETKMSDSELAQRMASVRMDIPAPNAGREVKVDFQQLGQDPAAFARYVLYYRSPAECPHSGNILRLLSQHPEIERDFLLIDVNQVDKNMLRSQGVRGTPSVLTDRSRPGVAPLLGDDALRWLSRLFTETITPCCLGDDSGLCGTPINGMESCIAVSSQSSISPNMSSLHETSMTLNGNEESLDTIDGSATLVSERNAVSRDYKQIAQQWQGGR